MSVFANFDKNIVMDDNKELPIKAMYNNGEETTDYTKAQVIVAGNEEHGYLVLRLTDMKRVSVN